MRRPGYFNYNGHPTLRGFGQMIEFVMTGAPITDDQKTQIKRAAVLVASQGQMPVMRPPQPEPFIMAVINLLSGPSQFGNPVDAGLVRFMMGGELGGLISLMNPQEMQGLLQVTSPYDFDARFRALIPTLASRAGVSPMAYAASGMTGPVMPGMPGMREQRGERREHRGHRRGPRGEIIEVVGAGAPGGAVEEAQIQQQQAQIQQLTSQVQRTQQEVSWFRRLLERFGLAPRSS